jgi:hypothetical protein
MMCRVQGEVPAALAQLWRVTRGGRTVVLSVGLCDRSVRAGGTVATDADPEFVDARGEGGR